MDTDWNDDDAALLEQVLSGDLSERDPRVQERLRQNPALAAELASLVQLRDGLGRVGAERQEDYEAALGAVTERDVTFARAAMARHYAAAAPRRRRVWPTWVAAAAAALLVGAFGWWIGGGGRPVQDTTLHSGDPTAEAWGMEPRGEGTRGAFAGFAWREPTPSGGYWRVAVYRAEDGARTDELLARADEVDDGEWRPDEAQRARILVPAEICWVLEPVRADGSTGRSVRAFVRFSD
ncbi:MAG: hypothetical protein AB7O97_02535 [Planctomycetota bacterium]